MAISSILKKKLEAALADAEVELEAASIQVDETASFGDFRENDPFHIAKAKFVATQEQIQEIKEKLAEQVVDPIGSSIVLGRLLKIKFLGMVDGNGNIIEPANEEMLLLYYESGDPVVEGILSEGSELGRQIKNGREGLYAVNAGNNSRLFDVRIYKGDVEEYFKRYPSSKKKKIQSLLGGDI